MAFHSLHDIQSLFLAWDNAEPDPYSESPLGKINAVVESFFLKRLGTLYSDMATRI
jgi:hypothetical protein